MKMQMKMNKQQSGFTLIELVMVIVVLGVLAATALPKFVNLGSDARAAAMKAVEGSMRSANVMIYAKAATANLLTATDTVPIDGSTSIDTRYGYAITVLELVKAMDLSADYTPLATTITHSGAITAAGCRVTYVRANATTAPTYTTVTTGC